MKENNREKGARKEAQAAAWLEGKGLQILERNYRCKKGEIDLIAREDGTYVFLEVKYRKGEGSGHPAEAVDERKQKRISGSALWYLTEQGAPAGSMWSLWTGKRDVSAGTGTPSITGSDTGR